MGMRPNSTNTPLGEGKKQDGEWHPQHDFKESPKILGENHVGPDTASPNPLILFFSNFNFGGCLGV